MNARLGRLDIDCDTDHYRGDCEWDAVKEKVPYDPNGPLSPSELAELEEELEEQQQQIFERAMKLKKAIALYALLDELKGRK
jgi:hypothetical protein